MLVQTVDGERKEGEKERRECHIQRIDEPVSIALASILLPLFSHIIC